MKQQTAIQHVYCINVVKTDHIKLNIIHSKLKINPAISTRVRSGSKAYLITSQLVDNLDGSLRDSIVLTTHCFEDFGDVAQGGDLIQERGLGGKQTNHSSGHSLQGLILHKRSEET